MQKNRNIFFKCFRDWNLQLYRNYISNSPYLDLEEYFSEYKLLEDQWLIIRKEIEQVIKDSRALPKFHELDDGQEYISDNALIYSLL